MCIFLPWSNSPLVGRGLFVIEILRSHSDTPHSFGRVIRSTQRPLYLTTHNIHKRQISMLPAGFEPTILASEGSQTHALDRVATGIGVQICIRFTQSRNYNDQFISVFNQIDAQNLFHNKFYFMPLHVSSLWNHHTYRCDDTRGRVMQF